ncbi:unnamed protein product [Linum trigynum]|uniref:Uncharacterized protein n=1 Tax=Linum trigynum TaxID=586398 RepID=A0AAV2FBW2_9ROSI
MAVVENLALLLDVTMPPIIILPERETRLVALDLLLSLLRRQLHHLTDSSNVNGVDFDNGKENENGNDEEGEGDPFD